MAKSEQVVSSGTKTTSRHLSVEDLIINYEPEFLQQRLPSAGLQAAQLSVAGQRILPALAGQIHARSGAFTTAASAIATWAVIDAACD